MSIKEKYLISALIRRDGSTKFGPENRFGYFPTASLGWVLSDESFLEEASAISFFQNPMCCQKVLPFSPILSWSQKV